MSPLSKVPGLGPPKIYSLDPCICEPIHNLCKMLQCNLLFQSCNSHVRKCPNHVQQVVRCLSCSLDPPNWENKVMTLRNNVIHILHLEFSSRSLILDPWDSQLSSEWSRLWPLVPVSFMKQEFDRRHLVRYRLPHHVNSIIWLHWVLVSEMNIHLLQSVPHFSPLGPMNTSQQFHHKALLNSICGLHKETKLTVIQLLFKW